MRFSTLTTTLPVRVSIFTAVLFCVAGPLGSLTNNLLGTSSTAFGEDAKEATDSENKLLGSWQMISAKINNEKINLRNVTNVKHITPTSFMLASYDGRGLVNRAIGGSYTIKGNIYVETPEYGTGRDFAIVNQKPQHFSWEVKGDKWIHEGRLSDGTFIDEVWQRIK